MKTFRSDRYEFEIDVPSGWRCPHTGFLSHLLGLDRNLEFSSSDGFFIIEVGHDHSLSASHLSKGIHSGEISVYGRTHQWACHITGMETTASRRIVKKVRSEFRKGPTGDLLSHMSDESWVAEIKRGSQGRGPIVKIYWLIFENSIYTITASIGFGAFIEVIQHYQWRESLYDKIVSTFRPCKEDGLRTGSIKETEKYFEAKSNARQALSEQIPEFRPCALDRYSSPQAVPAGTQSVPKSFGILNDAEKISVLKLLTDKPSEMAQFQFDIFVSYRTCDAILARQIAEQLIASGIKPCFLEYELPLTIAKELDFGSKKQDAIENSDFLGFLFNRAIGRCKYGLFLARDAYFTSKYTIEELRLLLKSCGVKGTMMVKLTEFSPESSESFSNLLSSVFTQELTEAAQIPSMIPTIAYQNDLNEILSFIESHFSWRLDRQRRMDAKVADERYSGVYCNHPYTFDFGGWELFDKGGGQFRNFEVGPSLRQYVGNGELIIDVLVGEIHDKNALKNRADTNSENDRLYNELYNRASKLGEQPYGMHLLLHGGFWQYALTYFFKGKWERKYSVILENEHRSEVAEFIFTFNAYDLSFQEFCHYAYIADDIVTSLRWG